MPAFPKAVKVTVSSQACPSARGSGRIPSMAVQMSRARFGQLVQEALGKLPPESRRYLNGLEVRTCHWGSSTSGISRF